MENEARFFRWRLVKKNGGHREMSPIHVNIERGEAWRRSNRRRIRSGGGISARKASAVRYRRRA